MVIEYQNETIIRAYNHNRAFRFKCQKIDSQITDMHTCSSKDHEATLAEKIFTIENEKFSKLCIAKFAMKITQNKHV